MLYPAVCERVDNRLGGHVLHGNGHGPTREAVDCREQVAVAVGSGKRHYVDVDMLKSPVRHLKVADRRDDVFDDLCLLTGQAFAGPSSNILLHGWPDYFLGYHFPCPLDAWMA